MPLLGDVFLALGEHAALVVPSSENGDATILEWERHFSR
jgi:hypothetical protein